MNILRNPEVKKELLISVILTAVISLAGSFVYGAGCALFTTLAGIVVIVTNAVFSTRRYRRISEMSSIIDEVLHSGKNIPVSDMYEGELGILGSEIHKMTVRITSQSEQLMEDKVRLTDAIADIFHQLRTPLTAMNIAASMLTDDEISYEKRKRLARDIKRQLERIQWLVESLLKLSKIDAGTAVFSPEMISVRDLIAKASAPFVIPMEVRGQSFVTEISDETLNADISWTTEAIGNLLKNCMEHTPEDGTVTVSALENALFTEIRVSDTGEGFDSEDIPYLFDRFYKGKNAVPESIGIGLALSRVIIAAQNGTIKAENSPDGGAVFTVRFYKSVV